MSKEKKLFVERESYTKNDKEYFTYFIKGNIRGRDVRIAIMPPADGAKADFNGYMVLDIVFGNQMKAEFVLEPFEFKDAGGRTVSGNKTLVRTVNRTYFSFLYLLFLFFDDFIPDFIIKLNFTFFVIIFIGVDIDFTDFVISTLIFVRSVWDRMTIFDTVFKDSDVRLVILTYTSDN